MRRKDPDLKFVVVAVLARYIFFYNSISFFYIPKQHYLSVRLQVSSNAYEVESFIAVLTKMES